MKLVWRVVALLFIASMCIGIETPQVSIFGASCQRKPAVRYYDNTVQATPSYMTGDAQNQAELRGGIK